MKGIKIFGYVLLAFLFISTVPYAAEAGNVKIYPDQFKPVNPSDTNNWQDSSGLRGNLGLAVYYAAVNLPIGRTVTRLVMYHSSFSGTTSSEAFLYRFQFGAADPYGREMAVVNCAGNTGDEAVACETTTIDYPLVKSGFRYWVLVNVTSNNQLHGVKVVYE